MKQSYLKSLYDKDGFNDSSQSIMIQSLYSKAHN